MKKVLIAVAAAFAFISAGCHGQVPPTVHSVTITVTPPSGCTGCTYVISRAPASGSTCPVTTGTNYAPLNSSSPMTGTIYVDPNAAGLDVCYIGQTLEAGAVSQPSNTVGPFAVAANPLAPSLNGTQAMAAPQVKPTGDARKPELMAKVN